jgi:hypothetical protein
MIIYGPSIDGYYYNTTILVYKYIYTRVPTYVYMVYHIGMPNVTQSTVTSLCLDLYVLGIFPSSIGFTSQLPT